MDIDTHEATERLVRELRPTESRRRPIVVALIACAVVAVALLAWSNRGDVRRDLAPADDRTPSPQVAEEPFYLDLADGARTPAPPETAALFETSGDLVFSPSGDRVVYSTCLMGAGRCSADDQLFLADADGSDPRRVNPPAGLNAYLPAWSPDGTKLVYQARQGGVADVGDLYVHDLATGERTRITDFDLSLPMWWAVTSDVSMDAEHIVYSLPRTADVQTTWDVWEVPLVGGDPTRLFENAGSPQYLADGRIAFLREAPEGAASDTLVAAAPRDEPEILVEGVDEAAVSPDGTRVAYLDDGVLHLLDIASGRSELFVASERFSWIGDDRLLVLPARPQQG